MKMINLLGATGSIGRQTLDVIRSYPDQFKLAAFSFHQNETLAHEIINEFKPYLVSCGTSEQVERFKRLYPDIHFASGYPSLIEVATYSHQGMKPIVVTALVGSIGLVPTVAAIKSGYPIALANKETLVTAGHIVMALAKAHQVPIIPVDSEHSAIFQALNGEKHDTVKRLIITASGGSFRNKTRSELADVRVKDALNHPNWSMGAKITIDSATMMNKGFEVIEAHWLFDLPYDQIETMIHYESVIHSMVEFVDHSIIAQLGTPDMRLPIQYALTYPQRKPLLNSAPLDLTAIGTLHFYPMDFKRYPLLKYAYDAGKIGGSMPTVLNASNEAAVNLFLNQEISFLEIEKIVYNELETHKLIKNPDLETVLALDQEIKARLINRFRKE